MGAVRDADHKISSPSTSGWGNKVKATKKEKSMAQEATKKKGDNRGDRSARSLRCSEQSRATNRGEVGKNK